MKFLNLLLDDVAKPIPDWISKSFPIIQTILIIIVAIAAVAIIVASLMTKSNPDGGNNAITQHKGGNREGRLKKIVVACAIVIFVATLIYFISFGIYVGFTQ